MSRDTQIKCSECREKKAFHLVSVVNCPYTEAKTGEKLRRALCTDCRKQLLEMI